MFKNRGLKTFAMSAKNLSTAERFYTQVLGGAVVRRIEPTEDELKNGRIKEVDVQLGNFQVHIFDASKGPRPVDPHHTLNIPWQEKEKALKQLESTGAQIEKVREHANGKGYSINVLDPDGNRWELSFQLD